MQSQFSIIFVLATQYRSHSIPLNNAVHFPRWFLSMGSRRLHSMQQGSGWIAMRWRCAPKQSCPTHSRNSATEFLLGQSGTLVISCFHGFWDNFVSSSCLYTLWNTCFKCTVWSYVYWTVHHLDSWVKIDQLDVTCFIISLFNAQHV